MLNATVTSFWIIVFYSITYKSKTIKLNNMAYKPNLQFFATKTNESIFFSLKFYYKNCKRMNITFKN